MKVNARAAGFATTALLALAGASWIAVRLLAYLDAAKAGL